MCFNHYNQNSAFVEADTKKISAKFQLSWPYSVWRFDFFLIFSQMYAFLLPWQPIKLSHLHENDMLSRGLHKEYV